MSNDSKENIRKEENVYIPCVNIMKCNCVKDCSNCDKHDVCNCIKNKCDIEDIYINKEKKK